VPAQTCSLHVGTARAFLCLCIVTEWKTAQTTATKSNAVCMCWDFCSENL